MYDIIAMIWFCSFIVNLWVKNWKRIPSVSFNLRHGGSAIDRKDSKQAIPEIIKLGEYIEKNKRAAVIFQKELEVKQVSQEYLHRVD
jgi:1-acyl-sn-glycerol-3-phosphate acyltransferase